MDIRKYLVRVDANGHQRPLEYDITATKSPLAEVKRNRNRNSPYSRPKARNSFIDSEKQYILDLGQKNIGASECGTCHMLYQRGDAVDEKHHQNHHDGFVNGLKFAGWKQERTLLYLDNGARVICVLPDDPKFMLKKVEELFSMSDHELGIHVSLEEMRDARQYVYLLYISPRRRIGGFVVGEKISQASRLVCDNPLTVSKELEQADVGVSRLWVHHKHRAQGIGRTLVDVLRANLYREKIVPKNLVAFSDPTIAGKEFARKYTEEKFFLVYAFTT